MANGLMNRMSEINRANNDQQNVKSIPMAELVNLINGNDDKKCNKIKQTAKQKIDMKQKRHKNERTGDETKK